jgi:hypothetical protein
VPSHGIQAIVEALLRGEADSHWNPPVVLLLRRLENRVLLGL